MGNKRRVQRLITVIVLLVKLAPSPAAPCHLFDLGSWWINIASVISVMPLSLSLKARYHIHGEFRWALSAIGGTSCILPDFVYLAVYVHCSHPLIFGIVSSPVGDCSVANGNCSYVYSHSWSRIKYLFFCCLQNYSHKAVGQISHGRWVLNLILTRL